jgi:hypothetical protein
MGTTEKWPNIRVCPCHGVYRMMRDTGLYEVRIVIPYLQVMHPVETFGLEALDLLGIKRVLCIRLASVWPS